MQRWLFEDQKIQLKGRESQMLMTTQLPLVGWWLRYVISALEVDSKTVIPAIFKKEFTVWSIFSLEELSKNHKKTWSKSVELRFHS